MRKHKGVSVAVLVGCGSLAFVCAGEAQALRAFVATSGNDANPCTRNAPCRTLTAGVNAVGSGGDVVVLDSGNYAAVTIAKSVKIGTAEGVKALVTAATAGANAVTINAGASDTVVLRGLTLVGLRLGNAGVQLNSAGALQIEECVVDGFQNGIAIETSGISPTVSILDTVSRNNVQRALFSNPSGGVPLVAADNSRFENSGLCGFAAFGGTHATVTRSAAIANQDGFCAQGINSQLSVKDSLSANNQDRGFFSLNGAVNRASNCVVSHNGGFGFYNEPGSTFESLGNNLVRGNGGGDTFGTITLVTPQ